MVRQHQRLSVWACGCYPKPWDNSGKFQAFSRLKAGLATRQVQLPDDDGLIQELLTLEARPTRSGATFIGASGGAKDDRATVVAALMDMTASATLSPAAATNWRELINDVRSPGGAASRFGDVIGVPGLPNFGLDQLDRL